MAEERTPQLQEFDDEVEGLLADCLADPGAAQSKLEELCQAHPELAAELRGRADSLRSMGMFPSAGADPAAPELPEQLGDFRPLARIGAGGMGVVYRAEQMSLGREVALKIVRPELVFFPGTRERFRREVAAVARLKHSGIVPVYAVGEEQNLPYFAMELVEGATLAELIADVRERSPIELSGADLAAALARRAGVPSVRGEIFEQSWVEAVLSLGRDVARALEHAHGEGILHRDVKPSNIALSTEGRARLLDFGLAASEEIDPMTRPGTATGTVHYMAPEQVSGLPVDARADVWGLGVTLYELLALALPFEGAHTVEIRKRILEGRPAALRSRNSKVSRDAALVVSTAMELDVERRYTSAALLAEDLEHVLAHRPPRARPLGIGVSIQRWVRRKPALAVGLVLGFLLLTGIPAALLVQQQRHTRALETRLKEETRLRREADLALAESNGVADYMLKVFEHARPSVSGGAEITILDAVRDSAGRLSDWVPNAGARAQALYITGTVYRDFGQYESAIESFEQALELERAASDPDLVNIRALEMELAGALFGSGKIEQGEALLRATLEECRPVGPQHRFFATLLHNLSRVLIDQNRLDEAREALDELAAEVQRIGSPDTKLHDVFGLRALLEVKADQAQAALEWTDRALAAADSEDPAFEEFRTGMATIRGGANRRLGRYDEAEAAYRDALATYERMLGPNHDVVATQYSNLATVYEQRGEWLAAIEHFEKALAIRVAMGLEDHPTAVDLRDRIERLIDDGK